MALRLAFPPEILESLQLLDQVVRGAEFQEVCDAFLDEHCAQFASATQEENKLEWTQIHQQYENLVEGHLTAVLSPEKITALCEELPGLIQAEDEAMAPFSETVDLLINFTDYCAFKAVMLSRYHDRLKGLAPGSVRDEFGATSQEMMQAQLASTEEVPAEISALLGESERLYQLAQQEGWTEVVSKENFSMSTIRAMDENGKQQTYTKSSLIISIGVEHQKALWCEYGPSRDRFDKGFMFAPGTRVLQEVGPDDVIFEGSFSMIPKLLKWAMRFPEPAQWRITTRALGDDGSFCYSFVLWDAENGSCSTKMDMKETGMMQAHPTDPGKSFFMSVVKTSGWIPNWVMGKLTERMVDASMKSIIASYRENVLGLPA